MRFSSPAGSLWLTASSKGLCGIDWNKQKVAVLQSLKGRDGKSAILRRAVKELSEYFQGRRKTFGLPLDATGTLFQKKVWRELLKIPYGKTCSYQDIARRIRRPKATRAVGTANGQNPLCIVVPCHRVIASDGSLGGYSGGLKIKRKLLAVEKK